MPSVHASLKVQGLLSEHSVGVGMGVLTHCCEISEHDAVVHDVAEPEQSRAGPVQAPLTHASATVQKKPSLQTVPLGDDCCTQRSIEASHTGV